MPISNPFQRHYNKFNCIFFFRIYIDEGDHVAVQYKKLSTDDVWHPRANEKPLELFRLNSRGKQQVPKGHPPILQQFLDEEEIKDLIR